MSSPVVSVCIPTYNGAAYVERTIRSVLAQTWSDFELVVCDDGSTDATLEVVARCADPRLRVVATGERVGAGANFQRALGLARGTYVKLLGQDDVLYPNCLARQVDALDETSESGVVMVSCRRDIVDDGDRVIYRDRGWRGAAGVITGARAMRATVRAGTNLIGEPSAVLCVRSAFEAAGGFDPTVAYMIDLEAWLRLLRRGDLAYLPESLCTFRVSPHSWSASLGRSQAREARAMLRASRARYPDTIGRSDLAVGFLKPTLLSSARRAMFAARRVLPDRAPSAEAPADSADVP